MKKFLSALVVVTMVFACFSRFSALAGDEDFYIIGTMLYKYNGADTHVVIPDGVTEIGGNAFWYKHLIVSITIPDSVTKIAVGAFSQSESLEELIVTSGNLTFSSEDGVLYNKDKTKLVRFPVKKPCDEFCVLDGVVEIGEEAFYKCRDIISVTLPDGLKSIERKAFTYCWLLVSISLPDSLETLDMDAFFECVSLDNVVIPGKVEAIGYCAFFGCTSLSSVTISEGVKWIDSRAFRGCESLTSISLPNSVECIGSSAFDSCVALTSVEMSDKVRTIDSYAFTYCPLLSYVVVPGSVEHIGLNAFDASTTLVVVPDSYAHKQAIAKSWLYVFDINSDFVIYNTKLVRYVGNDTNVVVPDGVTEIDELVFFEYKKLESITLPDSIKVIGYGAFAECGSLKSVVIPDGVERIGDFAFAMCDSLEFVTFPESVRFIGAQTFGETNVIFIVKAGGNAQRWANRSGRRYVLDFISSFDNVVDVYELLKLITYEVPLSAAQVTAADVSGDSKVNCIDALAILKYVVNK